MHASAPVKLTLPVPPSANDYWKIWRGRAVVSAEARSYKQGVKLRALTEGLRKPLSGPVVASVAVYRKQRRGDLDNFLKVLLDALKGIAFEDDSQVSEIHASRFEDPSNPRVVVTIEELPKEKS
jgi:crossover junction endodeoxyribonuclease RusA